MYSVPDRVYFSETETIANSHCEGSNYFFASTTAALLGILAELSPSDCKVFLDNSAKGYDDAITKCREEGFTVCVLTPAYAQ